MSDLILHIEAKIASYKNLLADGDITQSEYDELIEDLKDIKNIEKMLVNEKNKITVANVIDIISKASSFI